MDSPQPADTRRRFLQQTGMGVGALALQWMLAQESAMAKPPILKAKPASDLVPRAPHFEPRAKAMISLFQHGGPSHMDLTDPKPELTRYDGTEYSGDIQFFFCQRSQQEAARQSLSVSKAREMWDRVI